MVLPVSALTLYDFCFVVAKSLDFGTAHKLISNVINEITALRNEQQFSKLFDQIAEFCANNNVELNINGKEKRLKTTSTRLKNFSRHEYYS